MALFNKIQDEENKALRIRLMEYQEKHGVNNTYLAKQLDLHPSMIFKFKKGERGLSPVTAKKLIAYLNSKE